MLARLLKLIIEAQQSQDRRLILLEEEKNQKSATRSSPLNKPPATGDRYANFSASTRPTHNRTLYQTPTAVELPLEKFRQLLDSTIAHCNKRTAQILYLFLMPGALNLNNLNLTRQPPYSVAQLPGQNTIALNQVLITVLLFWTFVNQASHNITNNVFLGVIPGITQPGYFYRCVTLPAAPQTLPVAAGRAGHKPAPPPAHVFKQSLV
jgi:hypothetical protein